MSEQTTDAPPIVLWIWAFVSVIPSCSSVVSRNFARLAPGNAQRFVSNAVIFPAALIDARMMSWLLELPQDTGFEILDGTLMCRTPRQLDGDVAWALETMATFLDRVPPVIESLFGSAR